ncbi:MAG: hypothetical protein HY718_04965 [Planctomycetes bacterium]|nr:hypothetical protein [Planctomycetota bacterium]
MNANHNITLRVVALILTTTIALSAQGFDLVRYSVDGGGGVSVGDGFTLSDSIGQPDAHVVVATDGLFLLKGGFWVVPPEPRIPGDFDGDKDVDQTDFGTFQSCYTVPGDAGLAPACVGADLDRDGEVRLADFVIFQGCYSGADVPADPGCAQ